MESTRSPKDAMELKRVTKEGEAGVAEPSPASENKSVIISMQSEKEKQLKEDVEESSHDSQIGQGLRAAVLGANDGLVTTASLMMGVSAVHPEAMVLSGLAALVAGACSMAIGEFVSVQTQRDVEISILKKAMIKKAGLTVQKPDSSPSCSPCRETQKKALSPESITSSEKAALPNPLLAACASALAFSVGAILPLISAAFITNDNVRVGVLAGVSSLALLTFGVVGAYFGRASLVKGGLRVLIGGWIAMSVTYGMLKWLNHTEVEDAF